MESRIFTFVWCTHTPNNAAEMLKVNRSHLNNFVNGKVELTAPLAYKLHAFSGVSVEFWMSAQKAYELHKHYTEAPEVVPIDSVA